MHRAAATLNGDPFLWAAADLPLVGRQDRAAQRVAALGADLGDAGVDAAGILATLQQERDTQGQAPLEKVEDVLQQSGAPESRIAAKLQEAHRLRSAVPSGRLAGPLANALATLDKDLPRADEALTTYQDVAAVLPDVAGYNGPRTYLVLARDSSELVGSGGYDLAYGLVTFDRGRMTRSAFDDTNRIRQGDWPPPDPQTTSPHRPRLRSTSCTAGR